MIGPEKPLINPDDAFILPSKDGGRRELFALISINVDYNVGKWENALESLARRELAMLDSRKFFDFICHLKKGKVFNGRGEEVAPERVKAVLDSIVNPSEQWKGEYLDNCFLYSGEEVRVHYNHKLEEGKLVPGHDEIVLNYIREEGYIRMPNLNKQGVATQRMSDEEFYALLRGEPKPGDAVFYYYPRRLEDGKKSVTVYSTFKDGATLACVWNLNLTKKNLGVRPVQFYKV